MGTGNKIALIVEYEGTRYCGFQWQVGQPTIQGEIETALGKLTGEQKRVIAASRTDSGVHAAGQVVSFRPDMRLPLKTYVNGLNYYLPEDIAIKAAFQIADSFDIRLRAVSREYNYYILNRANRAPLRRDYCYQVRGRLNIEEMNSAGQVLHGEHDFASFTPEVDNIRRSTVRKIYQTKVTQDGDLAVFNVVANSFLHHQVRNTVGMLVRVGRGKMTVNEFRDILEAKEPGRAGPRAPACGLCLIRVNYPSPLGEMCEENADEDLQRQGS